MSVFRIPIQSRELTAAIEASDDTVLRRAGEAVAKVLTGNTVVIEEFIGAVGDEAIIEETILEAREPQP